MALQGVERTLAVLEALASSGAATLTDVSDATGLAKSAAHRILQSVCERGYAVKDPDSGRYRLGPAAVRLAAAGLEAVDLRTAAGQALHDLAAATGEAVHLVVPEGNGVVYVDKVESRHPVRMASRVGMRGELHSTAVGKAILAALPDTEVRALARGTRLPVRTPRTITGIRRLLAELNRVRSRGYAVDDEENETDVRCVGMAVLDEAGRPLGAVSVSAPAYRLGKAHIARVVPPLREAARRIEESCRAGWPSEHAAEPRR